MKRPFLITLFVPILMMGSVSIDDRAEDLAHEEVGCHSRSQSTPRRRRV